MSSHHHHHEHQTCRELLGSLSEYVDGTLDESLCQEIEKHMAGCDRCQIVIDTLRKTVELYHQTPEQALPDDVRKRLYIRLAINDFLTEQEQDK